MPDPLIFLLVAAVLAAVGLVIFWPERGFFWRWQRARRITQRVLREDALKPIAANTSVMPLPEERAMALEPGEQLTALKSGEQGQVVSISPACRGAERRRLMDLGILPGTLVEAEMTSPSGDPTAYRIRGTLIALRREQANLIHIIRQPEVIHER